MEINWKKVLEWYTHHPDELAKSEVAQSMVKTFGLAIEFNLNKLDPFHRASIFNQFCLEFPATFEQLKALPSPIRGERLLQYQLLLEYFINKKYDSEPEQISLRKYKPIIQNLIDSIKLELSDRSSIKITFDSLLKNPEPNFIEKLKEHYENCKPQDYVLMLYALSDLGLINIKPQLYENRTQLHEILQTLFKKVGTRQAFTLNLEKLSKASRYQNTQIDSHKLIIKGLIKMSQKASENTFQINN